MRCSKHKSNSNINYPVNKMGRLIKYMVNQYHIKPDDLSDLNHYM